jgi:hypothetical protein
VSAPVPAPGADDFADDYIIVGGQYPRQQPEYSILFPIGGTAECCLTGRVSEDAAVTGLLLERGQVVDT